MRYTGDTTYKIRDEANAIRKNRNMTSVILNKLRQGKGLGGISVDNLLMALETASITDIFAFKIDDVNLCDAVKNKKAIKLEVTMHDNFFYTRMLLDTVMPFHKGKDTDEALQHQKDKWISWFEKNLKEYHPLNKCTKEIVEK